MKVGELELKDAVVLRIIKIGWRYVDVEVSIMGEEPIRRRMTKNFEHHSHVKIDLER